MRQSVFFLFAFVAIALVSCDSLPDDLDAIKDVEGVDIGKGDDVYASTTYRGGLLPEYESSRADMLSVLSVVKNQDGEIDDDLFEEKLTTSLFAVSARFILIHDLEGNEPDLWTSALDWVGGQMFYRFKFNDDSTFNCRYNAPHDLLELVAYLDSLGIKGNYSTDPWRYDSDTDTLYTTDNELFAAKVLYFDGERAVLEGYVYPMIMYYDPNNVCNYRRSSPMELYLFEFRDGRDTYLDSYVPTEEYRAIREQFEANGGVM